MKSINFFLSRTEIAGTLQQSVPIAHVCGVQTAENTPLCASTDFPDALYTSGY